MSDAVADLLSYIDSSPTPYHAVTETAIRLEAEGFSRIEEGDFWTHEPGARHYVVRAGGSIIAFEVGTDAPSQAGFRMVGAHTDSPNLRIKPSADRTAHGYQQFAVEPYGGVLLHTWLDRDLSLAGRVCIESTSGATTHLIDFGRPLLRVPNLAIHLYQELREQGLKLNAQTHMAPVIGLEDGSGLRDLVVGELRAQGVGIVQPSELLSFDLMAYDTQPSSISGARGDFIHAPRLDNLASSHAGLTALLRSVTDGASPTTRALVLYDHEEVGSRSAQGAAGSFLVDVLGRCVEAFKGGESQGLSRALSQSRMVSADMAHAIHPNYADRHESGHQPVIGQGPVIKVNSNQAYATDAETSGEFAALCRQQGFEPQHFVTRSDLGCGSTIGPITAARLGVRTVDVGNPMLSMHSCREMAGTADVAPMIDVLTAFYSA